METTKIYIEMPVAERLPEIRHIKENGGFFHTVDKYGNKNIDLFDKCGQCFQSSITHWLEAVEVPTDELQKLKIRNEQQNKTTDPN